MDNISEESLYDNSNGYSVFLKTVSNKDAEKFKQILFDQQVKTAVTSFLKQFTERGCEWKNTNKYKKLKKICFNKASELKVKNGIVNLRLIGMHDNRKFIVFYVFKKKNRNFTNKDNNNIEHYYKKINKKKED